MYPFDYAEVSDERCITVGNAVVFNITPYDRNRWVAVDIYPDKRTPCPVYYANFNSRTVTKVNSDGVKHKTVWIKRREKNNRII